MSAALPVRRAAVCLDALNKHTAESDCFPVLGFRVHGTAFQTFLPLTFEISIVSPKLQDVAGLFVCVCVVAAFPRCPLGSTASMSASVRCTLVSIQQLISNLSPPLAVLTWQRSSSPSPPRPPSPFSQSFSGFPEPSVFGLGLFLHPSRSPGSGQRQERISHKQEGKRPESRILQLV